MNNERESRRYLEKKIEKYLELFPLGIKEGFRLHPNVGWITFVKNYTLFNPRSNDTWSADGDRPILATETKTQAESMA